MPKPTKDVKEEARKLVESLLTGIDEKSVLTVDENRGLIFIGGEQIDDARMLNLKSEAEFLLKSDVWKVIHETVKHIAQKTVFVDSQSLADLQKGKSVLYTLSTQSNLLKKLVSYKRKTQPK